MSFLSYCLKPHHESWVSIVHTSPCREATEINVPMCNVDDIFPLWHTASQVKVSSDQFYWTSEQYKSKLYIFSLKVLFSWHKSVFINIQFLSTLHLPASVKISNITQVFNQKKSPINSPALSFPNYLSPLADITAVIIEMAPIINLNSNSAIKRIW